jgi:tyrosine-protein phosphatase YwqE
VTFAKFIATDTHNLTERPPMLAQALKVIGDIFGQEYQARLINNSAEFYKKIILRGEN